MNTLSSVLLLLTGLAIPVSSISHPGTLSFPLSKGSDGALFKRQAGTLNSVITDIQQTIYYINFTYGTPPQPLAVALDTGSADLIVVGDGSSLCNQPGNCGTGTYDQGASSTVINTTLPLNNTYGDGTQILGSFVQDTLGLDGASIPNVYAAVATTGQSPNPFVGIMGIGYDTDEGDDFSQGTIYPNIIDSLKSSGQIASKTFSLSLNNLQASTGSVLFGGVDTSRFSGNLSILDIIPHSKRGYVDYIVPLVGISLGSSGTTTSTSVDLGGPQTVLLDSGSTVILLPQSVLDSLTQPLGLSVVNGSYLIPCSNANSATPLSFQLGGTSSPSINVALSELVLPIDSSTCLFGIQPSPVNFSTLGETFLRSAYVFFNQEDNVIGIAQANPSPGPSNIIALSATSGGTISIPSGVPVTSQASPSPPSTTSGIGGIGPVGITTSSVTSTSSSKSSPSPSPTSTMLSGGTTTSGKPSPSPTQFTGGANVMHSRGDLRLWAPIALYAVCCML